MLYSSSHTSAAVKLVTIRTLKNYILWLQPSWGFQAVSEIVLTSSWCEPSSWLILGICHLPASSPNLTSTTILSLPPPQSKWQLPAPCPSLGLRTESLVAAEASDPHAAGGAFLLRHLECVVFLLGASNPVAPVVNSLTSFFFVTPTQRSPSRC